MLSSGINHAKVLVNTIMSLASETRASSPVQLTESPFFQYQYSSLNDVIAHLSNHLPLEGEIPPNLGDLSASFLRMNMPYYEQRQSIEKAHNKAHNKTVYMLQTDIKALRKPHSPTLEGQRYVYNINNKVPGNKTIIPGQYYSYVNVGYVPPSLRGGTRWSLPGSIHRLGAQEDGVNTAYKQVQRLLTDKELPFKTADLVINTLDSAYSQPRYIVPCWDYDNLVNIIRLRHASTIWTQVQIAENTKPKGAPRSYGDPFYLHRDTERKCFNPHTKQYEIKEQDSIFLIKEDEYMSFESTTTRGRKIITELWRWNDLLLRTQDGFVMKDKPFDLFAVKVTDVLTATPLFKNDLFAGIFGKKRHEITLLDAFKAYRQRFDIEVHNRFSNQALLLDAYQSPIIEHIDNWAAIVMLTYWFLFIAADDVQDVCYPWERYDKKYKQQQITEIAQNDQQDIAQQNTEDNNNIILPVEDQNTHNQQSAKPFKSVAQTRKAASKLFSTFDLSPFKPKPINNGKGRVAGTTQTKRTKHSLSKKTQIDLNTRANV